MINSISIIGSARGQYFDHQLERFSRRPAAGHRAAHLSGHHVHHDADIVDIVAWRWGCEL